MNDIDKTISFGKVDGYGNGETVQLLSDDHTMNSYLRELAAQNSNELDDEEIQNSKDEYKKI